MSKYNNKPAFNLQILKVDPAKKEIKVQNYVI